ncbi:MAG: cyclic pyranopterin monophosphate synthase MoaC [Gemmatimonadota bacterium]
MSLTHLDAAGRARMVDVGPKPVTARRAVAEGRVVMSADAFALVQSASAEKGDVIAVAELAGVMGAKRTSDLIPLCHPVPLDRIGVTLELHDEWPGVRVVAEAAATAKTGIEMEALVAVSVACLTVYDMVKAVDRGMRIEGIRLLEKSGGQRGDWLATDWLDPNATEAR